MVLIMALCKESYKLKENLVDVSVLKPIFEENTGLEVDFEVCDKTTIFVHCDKFKFSIEIDLDLSQNKISIYLPPKKNGYFEYAVLYSLSSFIENHIDIPEYAKKKWKELSFLEKTFRR